MKKIICFTLVFTFLFFAYKKYVFPNVSVCVFSSNYEKMIGDLMEIRHHKNYNLTHAEIEEILGNQNLYLGLNNLDFNQIYIDEKETFIIIDEYTRPLILGDSYTHILQYCPNGDCHRNNSLNFLTRSDSIIYFDKVSKNLNYYISMSSFDW